MRRLIFLVAALIVFTFGVSFTFCVFTDSKAEESAGQADELAIKGYDAVAYFTLGRPVEGKPEFEYEWRDAIWRFANKDHFDHFVAEPDRYAPRYGGHCAGSMARDIKAPINPESFAIIDGKLYVAFNDQIIEDFARDAEENVPAADRNWQRLQDAD